jgi:hypothetical protein
MHKPGRRLLCSYSSGGSVRRGDLVLYCKQAYVVVRLGKYLLELCKLSDIERKQKITYNIIKKKISLKLHPSKAILLIRCNKIKGKWSTYINDIGLNIESLQNAISTCMSALHLSPRFKTYEKVMTSFQNATLDAAREAYGEYIDMIEDSIIRELYCRWNA